MTYEKAFEQFQRQFLSEALTEAKGNMCAAARAIGVHRNTVLRMAKLLGMRLAEFKPETTHHKAPVSKSPRRVGGRKKQATAEAVCPNCESKRYRTSQMGEGLVRCQDCYQLYWLGTESECAA